MSKCRTLRLILKWIDFRYYSKHIGTLIDISILEGHRRSVDTMHDFNYGIV